MVNHFASASIKLLLVIVSCVVVRAQTDADRERRISDLERKMRQLDPGFSPANAASIDIRLAELERRMEGLLDRSRAAPSDTVTATREQPSPEANPSQAPLQQVSVSGDYKNSSEGETRLPVSGYMEAHFNKAEGEPGRADFHRFVVLFGHSFSERIKFWSELE